MLPGGDLRSSVLMCWTNVFTKLGAAWSSLTRFSPWRWVFLRRFTELGDMLSLARALRAAFFVRAIAVGVRTQMLFVQR